MIGTAWNNGAHHSSGAGYGIKFTRSDRDAVFNSSSQVSLDLPNGSHVQRVPSASFQEGCIEIRDSKIGRWLIGTHQAPWPRGNPPKFTVVRVSANHFRVI